MSKRQHEETVEAIQLKLVSDADRNGEANEKEEMSARKGKIAICYGSDYGRSNKLVQFGPGGTVPFDTCTLNSVSLHCVQEWRDGVDGEVLEFLAKLAEHEKGEPESRKYCLNFFLAYAFKGDQEAVFSRNLSALLAVSGLADSIGAFSYSEGGGLAEFLAKFPQLLTKQPNFPRRYDVNVYCENDTLVEHYYADLKHWLLESNRPLSAGDQRAIRQCRLKFFFARGDTAEEMLNLFREVTDLFQVQLIMDHHKVQDFNKAADSGQDQRTFAVRIDCPAFALDEFESKNEKTGEILMLKFKREQMLNLDDDDKGMDEETKGGGREVEQTEVKRTRSVAEDGERKRQDSKNGAKSGREEDEAEEEEERVTWKTYQLVRCPAEEWDQVAGQCPIPFLKRTLDILY